MTTTPILTDPTGLDPAPSPTVYHCTASSTCSYTSTVFNAWVQHELTAHLNVHSLWYCHGAPSLPPTPENPEPCNLAFTSRAAFERHWLAKHRKNAFGFDVSLNHYDFFLGNEGAEMGVEEVDEAESEKSGSTRPRALLRLSNGKTEFLGGSLFWCGFCERVWTCNMMGKWEVDRFEHVGAHFERRNARLKFYEIGSWRWPELRTVKENRQEAVAAKLTPERKIGVDEDKMRKRSPTAVIEEKYKPVEGTVKDDVQEEEWYQQSYRQKLRPRPVKPE